jgi:hypothetical protein
MVRFARFATSPDGRRVFIPAGVIVWLCLGVVLAVGGSWTWSAIMLALAVVGVIGGVMNEIQRWAGPS